MVNPFILIVIFLVSLSASAQVQISADLSRVGDASHLELRGSNQWKYDLKRIDDQTVVLRAPPLDQVTLTRLRTHSDELVQKIDVKEDGIDGTNELTFHLKNKSVDFFDYMTDDPSRLIVDFYVDDEKAPKAPVAQAVKGVKPGKVALILPPKQANGKKSPAKSVTSRKPAATEFIQMPGDQLQDSLAAGEKLGLQTSEEPGEEKDQAETEPQNGVYDAGDPEFKRFSMPESEIKLGSVIASRGSVFLRFPPLKLQSPHLATLRKSPPVYEIVPQENRENKEAQLLLTLFKNKRRGVFLKTAREFLAKFPTTKYDEIVRYMIADTYYDLWQENPKENPGDFDTAMGFYRHLSEKYPDSPLAIRTLLLMGYSFTEKGDSFGALKALQRFLKKHPKTKFSDQVKISMAEAYVKLNRFEDALQTLDEVEKTALAPKDAIEASFRRGDVYFQQQDLGGAVKAYKDSITKYPASANSFANAWYNTAEAQFWQGKYKESLDSYREFLRRFPDNSHGGYAMTRVGEVLDILGAGEKRSFGAYLESQFRYRETPGANVARIRTLVHRMPDMKEKELKSALEEIAALTEKTELPDMKEFSAISLADGQYERGEYQKSTDGLVAFYQQFPNATNREKFQTRIVRNITEDMREKVDEGKFIEALRINSRFSSTWLKNSDRIDTRYYVGKAYEQAGVYKEAANVYRETLNKLYSIRGTSRETERGVFEVLPSVDALNLRLAHVATKEREYAKADDFLKTISQSPKLTEKELVERAQIAADVAEARGQIDTAKARLSELVATWKGQPSAVSEVYLRLAELNIKTKSFTEAETALTKIRHLYSDTGQVSEDTHAKALEMMGDVLLSRGKRHESVQAFKDLLNTYGDKRPLSSVRYKAGKILFEDGDFQGAERLWADLKNDSSGIWNKIAQEQLQNAKWRGDYKKYIDRIPAMQGATREGDKETKSGKQE